MNLSHILVFPNRIPHIDWKKYFPKFEYGKGNDVALHLIRFNPQLTYVHVKSNQVQGNIISFPIFEFRQILLPIYVRNMIWKAMNMRVIHWIIPCRSVIHIKAVESSIKSLGY